MIDVVAPAGFVPSAESESPSNKLPVGNSLSSNFEDIDSLIANEQQNQGGQPGESKKRTRFKHPPTTPAPRNPFTPDGPPKDDATTIANSQWDSDANRRKKRVLQIIMGSAAALAVLGVGTWALISSEDNQNVATNTAPNETVDPDLSNAAPVTPGDRETPGDTGDTTNSDTATEPTKDGANHSPDPNRQPATDPPSKPPTQAPTGPLSLTPVTDDQSAGQSSPPPLIATTPPNTAPQTDITPLLPGDGTKGNEDGSDTEARPTDDPKNSNSPLIASTENSLGALSEILKGQGTSLKQIEDIAQIQKERAMIGTPNYLIEKPVRKPIQIDRQLSAELTGWKLDGVPLIDAIRDIELLADVPITISRELLGDGNLDLQRKVTLKVDSPNFQSALEMLVADDGLKIEILQQGVLITSTPNTSVMTRSYPQSFCDDADSAGRLKQLIVAVTGISDWDSNEEYQLEVSADSITVSHLENQHKAIKSLIDKLTVAANYREDPAATKESLIPLVLKAQSKLELSPNLKSANPFRRSMRLGDLFRIVHRQTKLNTVIDWQHLTEQGWHPDTRTPGGIDEPTNRELLDQLGRGMELATVVVGSDTVMLTTFENAAKQNDVEVYSVGDVIDSKMTPAQLDQLLTETLGVDQLSPPNAVVIYFSHCKCLVARAPQIIQRQLNSIIDKL